VVHALKPFVLAESSERRDGILGCLLGGALGDAYGGIDERGRHCLSDDTQLTLATCESIADAGRVDPAHLASTFRRWFHDRRFTGLGSSTLKALRDLQAGAHWALSGARGEMAAGNGGAMRIAPLAFVPGADRVVIRDVVRITHHSDEAYIGALAVVEAIQAAWPTTLPDLLHAVAEDLPDSRVRDRLVCVAEVTRCAGLHAVAALGTSGHVVDTVPLSLVAAWHMVGGSFSDVIDELTRLGGDVDTIASIAGQVAGWRLGARALPTALLHGLPERELVERIGDRFAACGGVE
jgi:ADP-ribosyl-[dinitrogen reductase] hydrolase